MKNLACFGIYCQDAREPMYTATTPTTTSTTTHSTGTTVATSSTTYSFQVLCMYGWEALRWMLAIWDLCNNWNLLFIHLFYDHWIRWVLLCFYMGFTSSFTTLFSRDSCLLHLKFMLTWNDRAPQWLDILASPPPRLPACAVTCTTVVGITQQLWNAKK